MILGNFPVKIGLIGGEVGVPEFFFDWNLPFCVNWEPMQKYDKSFWDIFEISPFSGQNRVNWGGRGVLRNSSFIGILLFLLLRSPCKISKL